MSQEKLYDTAKLIGYNQFDDIVYSERLSLCDYYDGEHIWDSSEGILKLRMARMVGKLYDATGKMFQEFESAYSVETGRCIGGRTKFDDGTTRAAGNYAS
jgi:hypothetical protein